MNSNIFSAVSLSISSDSNPFNDVSMQARRSRFNLFSTIMRNTPMAERRRAKGSLEPVGGWPMANNPAIESSLSEIANMLPMAVDGRSPPAYLGIYCSLIAVATSSGSPSLAA